MAMDRVVIVGGGVLGMMHATAARQRGLDVIQLEREAGPRGATVRNFGLVWVSGRAGGGELGLALRARELWEQVAEQVPATGFRPHPSLTLASGEAELSLLKEAAARPDAAARGYELLDEAGARAVSPVLRGEFLGGLLCHRDAIVEPRQVPGALREYLLTGPAGRAGTSGGPGARRSKWPPTASAITPASGTTPTWSCCAPAPTTPASPARTWPTWEESPVRRVRLQMLQTAPFAGQLTTSLADGDSLRYYPAYDLPGRLRLPPQAPAGAAARAQLLLVQRLDGSLTIGDTHEYDEPFAFDVTEEAYDHLRGRAERLLGTVLPPTQRRWAGVYSQVTTDELYHRSQVAPGVILVTGPGGRGMTCAPAIAEETFA